MKTLRICLLCAGLMLAGCTTTITSSRWTHNAPLRHADGTLVMPPGTQK